MIAASIAGRNDPPRLPPSAVGFGQGLQPAEQVICKLPDGLGDRTVRVFARKLAASFQPGLQLQFFLIGHGIQVRARHNRFSSDAELTFNFRRHFGPKVTVHGWREAGDFAKRAPLR